MRPESVVFTYDGATTATATITGAQIGDDYRFSCGDPSSASMDVTASGTTVVLVINDIGGVSPGDSFYARADSLTDVVPVGTTVFEFGTPGEFPFEGTWDFDGDKTVTFTFTPPLGLSYEISIIDSADSPTGSPASATGSEIVLTAVGASTFADDYFWALVQDTDTGLVYSTRLFSTGVEGEGFAGNPTNVPATGGLGVEVAPGAEAPVFTAVPESPLDLTTDFRRARLTVSKDSECVSLRFTQDGASAKTELYGVEWTERVYSPFAEGQ